MTEPDVLINEIESLKAVQREAWRELASPTLTTFDRREIRNRIRQTDAELRASLRLRSEYLRFRPRPAEEAVDSLADIEFRILAPETDVLTI